MPLPDLLRGIVPPIVTPLAAPDRLDVAGLERLVERILSAGVSGVFVLGTTGEGPQLSVALREAMIRETVRIVRGRVPVLAGISDASVAETIRLGRFAADTGAGADGVVFTPPYFAPVSQPDLLRHIRMVTSGVPLPAFLYNYPALAKSGFAAQTVEEALGIPRLAGMKDSSGDMIYLLRVLELARQRGDFSVLVGPEQMLGECVLAGAHGGVCGGANLEPELYVALYRAAAERNLEEMARLRTRALAIAAHVYTLGSPETSYVRGVKGALQLLGICRGLPAPPLVPLSPEEEEDMERRLALCGLIAPSVRE
jgi:4-hydroxy-tetrahydrodipicolinate synthase